MSNAATSRVQRDFPSLGIIHDRAGFPVDATGWVWSINDLSHRQSINWELFEAKGTPLFESAVAFIGHMIETRSPISARNAFDYIRVVFTLPVVHEIALSSGVLPLSIFVDLRARLGKEAYQLHYLRQWYCWAADHGYPNFCPDVAFELEHFRIGGNVKGQAVLSMDPEEGPLDDLEVAGLLNALRAASKERRLPLRHQAALWLCVAFGPNAIQPALMREEDIKEIPGADGTTAFVHVDVPRMKKGDALRRESFRRRQLTWEIGNVLLSLIEENRRERDIEGWPHKDFAFPLFVRKTPSRLAEGPLREYAMHITSGEFTALLKEAVDELCVVSHRTGKPLVATTRRLRYTYATRLVKEGVSKREIADLLDHSDLQNVQVYFDIKSDIVRPLDKAVALALGPIAQAFLGKLVDSEKDARRGDDHASRVAIHAADAIRPVGTCGSYGFCGLMAPVACYTCNSFQPWADAPHHLLLESLLADRDRKIAADRDGRMIGIYDDTILAIGDVIARIEAIRGRPA